MKSRRDSRLDGDVGRSDEARRADDVPRVVEWAPGDVRALVGDWLVELYPRAGSTERDVD